MLVIVCETFIISVCLNVIKMMGMCLVGFFGIYRKSSQFNVEVVNDINTIQILTSPDGIDIVL